RCESASAVAMAPIVGAGIAPPVALRLAPHGLEAIHAVDGPGPGGDERHLRGLPAVGADDVVHLAVGPAPVRRAPRAPAFRAATRLVHEPSRLIELLLARSKRELATTVATSQDPVDETHPSGLLGSFCRSRGRTGSRRQPLVRCLAAILI